MTRKTKAEAEATREQLLDAAEEVFLENGVAATTLEAIARRASLTRGAVYWHFRDKADLFQAMVSRVRPPLSELVEQLEAEGDDDPLEVVRHLCQYGLRRLAEDPRHRRIATILLHRCEHESDGTGFYDKDREDFLRLTEQRFAQAAASGRFNPALAPRTATRALHAYMMGLFSQFLRDPDSCDLAGVGDDLIDAFFDGLRQHPPDQSSAEANGAS